MMRALSVLALLLCSATTAFAQFETATVVGTLRDTTGAVVVDARVTLTNRNTGVASERLSDANGNYEFFTVRIGEYVVTAEKQGFSIAMADDVQVTVGARQRVDLTMTVGEVTETIRVNASDVLLQTDSSEWSQVIGAAEMRAL